MPINVSEALDSDTTIKVSVERYAPGSYVDGIYNPGATSTFTTLASPQQPTLKQLNTLPEGERDKDIMLFICKRAIRVGDDSKGYKSDIITFNGDRFKAIQKGDWSTFGHNIVFGVKL